MNIVLITATYFNKSHDEGNVIRGDVDFLTKQDFLSHLYNQPWLEVTIRPSNIDSLVLCSDIRQIHIVTV